MGRIFVAIKSLQLKNAYAILELQEVKNKHTNILGEICMIRFTRKRALVCGAAAFVVAVTTFVVVSLVNNFNASAATGTTSLWIGGPVGNTTYFQMTIDGKSETAYCGDRYDNTPYGANSGWHNGIGMTIVPVSANSSMTDKRIFGVMYLGRKYQYGVTTIHNALHEAVRGASESSWNQHTKNLFQLVNNAINDGSLFEGIKDAKYYYTNTKAINSGWQRIYTISYANQVEEKFNLSASKVWNDNDDPNSSNDIYDIFNGNSVTNIVPHSANVSIKVDINATLNDTTKTIRSATLNSGNSFSWSENDISCHDVKNQQFGVANDYSCSGLKITATETPLGDYASSIVFSESVTPQEVTIGNGDTAAFTFDNQFYTTFVNVTKTWNDDNTLENDYRPSYITFNVMYRVANSQVDEWALFKTYEKQETACSKIKKTGVQPTQKAAICSNPTENFNFDNLPAFLKINGKFTLVEYKAVETKIYDANETDVTSKFEITADAPVFVDSGDGNSRNTTQNIGNSATTSLPVKKIWIGDDDYLQDRPQSIDVTLMCGDNEVLDGSDNPVRLTLNADNNWEGEFTNLSKLACANYSAKEEVATLSHYASETNVEDGVYVFRNKHDVNVKVKKQWTGVTDNDPDVPELTVGLVCYNSQNTVLAQATLNEGNNWEYTWNNRDYDECGGADKYYVKEINYGGSYTLAGIQIEKGNDGTWVYTMDNVKTIDIPVTKAWVGRSDDMRLTEVTAVLLCEDRTSGNLAPYLDENGNRKEVLLNAGNNWTGSFTNISSNPFNDCSGFGIAEKSIDGGSLYNDGDIVNATSASAGDFKFQVHYTGDGARGFTITNEQLIDIPVEKHWDEDNDTNARRPESVMALLMCDNPNTPSGVVESLVLSDDNNWSGEWTNLSTSKCASYSVEEIAPQTHGYEYYYYAHETSGDESTGFVLTNTKYVNLKVVKSWNYRDPSKIPSSVQITLTCNGSDIGQPVTLNTSYLNPQGALIYNGFRDLKASDCMTGYGVREIVPAGADYNATVREYVEEGRKVFSITNTEEYNIPVEKRWDSGRSENDLPNSVDVALYCSDDTTAPVQQITLYKAQNWRGEFGPFENGSCNSDYYVEEVTDTPNFEATISGDEHSGFVITNTEYTHLEVNKTWEKRDTTELPRYIFLRLVCNDDPNNPTYVKSVIVRPDDQGIWSYDFTGLKTSRCGNYGVEEYLPGSDASFELTENAKTGDVANLVNTEQIYVPVRKDWDNGENTEVPNQVTVKLYCDDTYVDSATLEAPFYYHEFGPYGINDCAGKYRVVEDPEVAGFEISYSVADDGTLLITNTEEQEISVSKEWDIPEEKQAELPDSITVALWCETTDTEIANKRISLTKQGGYTGGWDGISRSVCTELGVREVAADGETILSTIGERYNELFFYNGVTGSAADGFTLSNSYDGIDIDGTKTWVFTDDYGNTQSVSKRPTQIYVTLKQNGVIVDTATVRADGAGNWNFNFDNWPKYDANGDEYVYTVDENAIAYYAKTINGYNITNKYQPEYTSVTASKDWATLKDTELPDQVEVKLFCGDTDLQNSKYITKASNWASVRWDNLDALECEAGYRVEEVLPEGYAKSVTVGSNNEYIFTNAETVDITVNKTWVKRETTALPESVKAALFCTLNGQRTQLDEQTLSAANNWTYTWTERNVKNDNCQGGAYVVDETSVAPNFQKTKVSYTDANGYVIENTELTSQKVIKVWEGDTNQNRPGSITAELMCGDVVKKTEVLSEANNLDGDNTWEYEWTNLLVSDCEQGYSVRESFDIPSYRTSYETLEDGTVVITNKRTTSQKVIKVWKNDDETKRPGYIEASLMCGDTVLDTVKLTKENDLDGDGVWEYEWTDLLVSDCEQGYSVDESINIPNYQKTVKVLEDGTVVITNEFDNPNTTDKTAASFGRIAGISSIVLIAGYFMTKRIMSRR